MGASERVAVLKAEYLWEHVTALDVEHEGLDVLANPAPCGLTASFRYPPLAESRGIAVPKIKNSTVANNANFPFTILFNLGSRIGTHSGNRIQFPVTLN